LEGQDDLDELDLVRSVWLLVRRGEEADAQELCMMRGRPWRAAAMSGGRGGGAGAPKQGLWREMCWRMRWARVCVTPRWDRSQEAARYEAAAYAWLAGNTRLLLTSELTRTWEDQVGWG
ncbi:unnamed protein product, partial [Discosporangium mesarthrocarpum]